MTQRNVTAATDYTLRDQELMKAARQYFAWQARMARQELGRRVIEVGCGVGNFTRHLLDRDQVVALDVELDCVAQLQRNLEAPANVTAMQLDVADPAFLELRSYQPDSVVCLNVLEHVRDDRTALRHMAAVLPQGGKTVLIVPAFEALYGPIDHNLGHFRRYSKRGFQALAAQAGFDARLRYMNSIGCVGWWVNARILKRTVQSEGQIATFDRWIVPLMAWMEGRIEPPFGQSIFAVLTKK
jgi:ubiquinone/menaquinone biosynthesis C-methylase UbiE